MNWMGTSFGMWAVSEAERDNTLRALDSSNASLAQWQEHAKKLQQALDELRLMYTDAVGGAHAQAQLKDLALAKIEKFDPSNKLLNPAYRKQIADKVREEKAKEFKKK